MNRRQLRLPCGMNPHGPPPPGIHSCAQPMLTRQITPESVSCSRSMLYAKPFALPLGGVVKARAFAPQGKQASEVATESFGAVQGK